MLTDVLLPANAMNRSRNEGTVIMAAMAAPRLIVPAMTGKRDTADIVAGGGEGMSSRPGHHRISISSLFNR